MDIGIDKQFEEVRKQVKYVKAHMPKNTIPAKFQDCIDQIYKSDMKPLIIVKKLLSVNGNPYVELRKPIKQLIKESIDFTVKFFGKEELTTSQNESWFFIVTLPPGIPFQHFKNQEQVFADSVMGSCIIDKEGKAVKVWISNIQLEKMYPYEFDPSQYVTDKCYLPLYFGMSSKGKIITDISDTHWFLSGETRFGKSNLAHCIIYGCLLINAKTKIKVFVSIVDFKRVEFMEFDGFAYRVTDINGVRDLFTKVLREIRRRENLFVKARVRKIQDYLYKGYELPFIIIVADELHKMQDEQCLRDLFTILSVGAGFGVLIFASTQRPSSTIFQKVKFGDMKANFDGKISFRASTEVDSRIILDNDLAAYLPKVKGRAIYKNEQTLELQTPYFPLHPSEEQQLEKLLSELDPYHFARSDIHDHYTPQKGILPRSKDNLIGNGTSLFECRPNTLIRIP